METVGADAADEDGAEDAHQEAGVVEGVGHRQDAGTQTSLQHMDPGLEIPAIKHNRLEVLRDESTLNISRNLSQYSIIDNQ